ncbi:MAG TPA: 3-dehydroquinate synthase family protein [Candidatus Nanoarchaeia archaeon]|nr:3-dehydroquinate synthase family protein [Candidatus Nanoarchaeia archaeon]
MKQFSTAYTRKDKIEFIIDDDAEMRWIGRFPLSQQRIFAVMDSGVEHPWGALLRKRLAEKGKELFFFLVDARESSKSLSFYPQLVDFLEQHRCNLGDLVMAIGGGVVIDLVSFTASTYMRGLPFVAIPTTLIGQIDAATAGKTCLNTAHGKNVLGTFYYPLVSYSNIHFLKTNSAYYLRQGYAEAFKYGLLGSPQLVSLIERHGLQPADGPLMEIMKLAMETRIRIRKRHPLASNLGHTFGHALEKMSGFAMLHGDAISAGTAVAMHFAEQQGIMKREERLRIMGMMKGIGLNMYIDQRTDPDQWVDLMMRDKKATAAEIGLVLIRGVGKPYEKEGKAFYPVQPGALRSFLKEFIKKYPYAVPHCAAFLRNERIAYRG